MATKQLRFTDYDGFTEKFKPKKTTDDCYTPEAVYDAMDLENISTEKLEKELSKRKDRDFGRCPNCRGKWTMYMGCSRSWREELHCYGCRKPIENCTC